jgi:hypothetical protein
MTITLSDVALVTACLAFLIALAALVISIRA